MTLSISEELKGLPVFCSLDQEQLDQVLDRHLETSRADQVIVVERIEVDLCSCCVPVWPRFALTPWMEMRL